MVFSFIHLRHLIMDRKLGDNVGVYHSLPASGIPIHPAVSTSVSTSPTYK